MQHPPVVRASDPACDSLAQLSLATVDPALRASDRRWLVQLDAPPDVHSGYGADEEQGSGDGTGITRRSLSRLPPFVLCLSKRRVLHR